MLILSVASCPYDKRAKQTTLVNYRIKHSTPVAPVAILSLMTKFLLFVLSCMCNNFKYAQNEHSSQKLCQKGQSCWMKW